MPAIGILRGSAVGGVCGKMGLPRASWSVATGLKAWGLRKRTDQPALGRGLAYARSGLGGRGSGRLTADSPFYTVPRPVRS